MRPVINLDEISEFDDVEENGLYTSKRAFVGEKIGATHLTYAQGACAEIVAMSTVGAAAFAGLPVSTTHVLSSGIAGTMLANKSGLQSGTVKKIAMAWVLTLPAAMLMSGLLYLLFRLFV